MNTVTFLDASNDLNSVLDQVTNEVEYTIIKRPNAQDSVVMSLKQFNGLMETFHLMSSPANAIRLKKAIEEVRAGNAELHDLIEE